MEVDEIRFRSCLKDGSPVRLYVLLFFLRPCCRDSLNVNASVVVMEDEGRLPLSDKRQKDARDAKLSFREELLADRTRATKRVCPCNVCLGENRSLRYRAIVRRHLRNYGRHPCHRGSTPVLLSFQTTTIIFELLCLRRKVQLLCQ